MNSKKLKVILNFGVILTLVLVLISSFSACSGHTYTVFKSISPPLFSFEYTSSYMVIEQAHTDSEPVAIEVHKKVSGTKFLDYPIIGITAIEREKDTISDEVMEKHLSNFAKLTNISDFQILERNNISISGENAEFVKYSYHGNSGTGMGEYVVFNSNDLIWTFEAVYDSNESNELDILFDRLVQTFKIVE